VTCGLPTIWADLLRYADEHDVDFSSLRRIMGAGAAVPRALMEAYQDDRDPHDQLWAHRDQPGGRRLLPAAGRGTPEATRSSTGGPHGRALPGVSCASWTTATASCLGRRVGGGDRGARVVDRRCYYGDPTPEKFQRRLVAHRDIGSVTPNGYLRISDPFEGRHQVGRGVDLLGGAGGPSHGPPRRRRGRGGRRARPSLDRAALAASCCARHHAHREELHGFLATTSPSAAPRAVDFHTEVPKTSVAVRQKLLRARYAGGELEVEEL